MVTSASSRVGSFNTRLAQLGCRIVDDHGGIATFATMAPAAIRRCSPLLRPTERSPAAVTPPMTGSPRCWSTPSAASWTWSRPASTIPASNATGPLHLHFTPTGSSWTNLVERWFAELTNHKPRRPAHRSVTELKADIRKWSNEWNQRPQTLRLDQDSRRDPRNPHRLLPANKRLRTLAPWCFRCYRDMVVVPVNIVIVPVESSVSLTEHRIRHIGAVIVNISQEPVILAGLRGVRISQKNHGMKTRLVVGVSGSFAASRCIGR